MDTPSYIYHEVEMGDLLVVEDLHYAEYAYAEGYDVDERYEIRAPGVRENFGTVEEVEDYLNVEIKPVVWYKKIANTV